MHKICKEKLYQIWLGKKPVRISRSEKCCWNKNFFVAWLNSKLDTARERTNELEDGFEEVTECSTEAENGLYDRLREME